MKKELILSFLIIAVTCIPGRALFAAKIEEEITKLEESVKPPLVTIERPVVTYNSRTYADPFKLRKPADIAETAEAEKEKPLPELKIQGIVWGGTLPQAIINGKIVKIGDTIEEVKILDIHKDGVDVIFNSRQYQILAPASIYKQATEEASVKEKSEGGTNEK